MHASVMAFAREVRRSYGVGLPGSRILEVGSLNVWRTLRSVFTGTDYTGIDMQPGPGVDEVVNAHQLVQWKEAADLPDFDFVICTEMLEHDDEPWTSVRQMHHMLGPGGYILLTCRGYDTRGCFPVHEYPQDLWRFSRLGIVRLLNVSGFSEVNAQKDPEHPGVFAIARR